MSPLTNYVCSPVVYICVLCETALSGPSALAPRGFLRQQSGSLPCEPRRKTVKMNVGSGHASPPYHATHRSPPALLHLGSHHLSCFQPPTGKGESAWSLPRVCGRDVWQNLKVGVTVQSRNTPSLYNPGLIFSASCQEVCLVVNPQVAHPSSCYS